MKRRFGGLVVLALLAVAGGSVTWAAYTATTSNNGNLVGAGTVKLSDNGDGSSMMSLAGAVPGNTTSACIKVIYDGSLAANVRLYGTTTGSGLDPYLNVSVTRGIYNLPEPAFKSCTNFQADSTDYIGSGAGVIYSGTLQGYADNYAAGLVDPTGGAPESWSTAEGHVYKFDVTLQNNFAAQNTDATQTFTWEARSQ
jgi:hypothetical protein